MGARKPPGRKQIPTGTGSPAPSGRAGRTRAATSTLLLQTTALAGTLIGLPMAFYSRAYAQASCTPSVSTYVVDAGGKRQGSDTAIPKATFACTITSDKPLTTPQYAYGGAYMFYKNPPTTSLIVGVDIYDYFVTRDYVGPASPQPGLNIAITSNADIDVGASATTTLVLPPGTSTGNLTRLAQTQANALGAVSLGSQNFYQYDPGKRTAVPANGGSAGAITITSTGSVSSSVGAGIYALSRGGDGISAYQGGAGGAVTVTAGGAVSGATGGVIAISQGGVASSGLYATYADAVAGAGGTVTVAIAGPVAATTSGPAVLAASYGGNQPRAPSTLRSETGLANFNELEAAGGGDGGTVTLWVGSDDTPFGDTISSAAVGAIGADSPARESGTALMAASIGGQGIPVKQGYYTTTFYSGGDGGAVTITLTGSDTASIVTAGDRSPAVIAQSAGGQSRATREGVDYVGGDGGTVTVDLAGGGSIATAGAHSSGIVAQSLGGEGQSNIKGSTYGRAGKGGAVTVTNELAITTRGARSHGIVAQSAAAAFGYGIYSYDGDGDLVWGDIADSSTGSGDVTVTNSGGIVVRGTDSHGIVAQSIGGGGGILTSTGTLAPVDSDKYADNGTQTVGGNASGAGGGTVTVENHGDISTYGGGSGAGTAGGSDDDGVKVGGGIAILAQSIGGGGGVNTGGGANGHVGGSAGQSDGDTVTVRNTATLTTAGVDAHAIVAQSIGGGGGVGRNNDAAFMSVGGRGGKGAAGGAASVEHNGAIVVSGDFASGVVVQSVGGGGGVGGKATSIGLVFDQAIGGTGGTGGKGGKATATTGSDSTVTTSGLNGLGLHVQSIGGGGGVGGAASSTSFNVPFPFSFSIATGGQGGAGGDGGIASAGHGGVLETSGIDATGILVQSIGGGGGAGGGASSNALALSLPFDEDLDAFTVTFSFSHGGTGGAAGDGAEAVAAVYAGASVATRGDGSTGVHVQSIGGGGGAGGDATAASTTFSFGEVIEDYRKLVLPKESDGDEEEEKEPTNIALGLDVGLGGDGGSGGNGGKAHAEIRGDVGTAGAFATGVLVQSIGGGGGAAGSGESQSSSDGSNSFALAVSVGGTGGIGGRGGTAWAGVFGTGSVTTTATGSRGVMVQSVGGGGGTSGGGAGDVDATTTLSIGLGRTGGAGGDGGNAYAWNDGTITTSGDFSDGLVAQSIGGGGGVGGSGTSSVSHEFEFERKIPVEERDGKKSIIDDPALRSLSVDLSVGMTAASAGGIAGNAGNVVVGQAPNGNMFTGGTTTTYGAFSHGILAQAIGGGGGVAGSSSNQGAEEDEDGAPDLSKLDLSENSIEIGASNGGGGIGGNVTVYAHTITTNGYASSGILAQSIGGGGGVGISSGFAMAEIDVTLGSTAASPTASIARTVTVVTAADDTIATYGDAAHGIVAQSIGGGGGMGSVALGTLALVNDDRISDVISVTLGSAAPAGDGFLDGGDVSITHAGAITTTGRRAAGIIAQSIGGGGGLFISSDASFRKARPFVTSPVDLVEDQSAASSGDVAIHLESGASIVTSGDGGVGIIAQALAGGGGLAGDLDQRIVADYVASPYLSYNDTATALGEQGSIDVTVASGASIVTSGDHAHGILAQSVGGTGRIAKADAAASYLVASSSRRNAFLTNPDSAVDITVDGSVSVGADTAWGVWAQIESTTINVKVGKGGSVSGSGTTGYTGGAIYTASSLFGTTTIDNAGTITGNIGSSVAGHTAFDTTSARPADTSAGEAGTVVVSGAPGLAVLRNHGTGTLVTGAVVGLSSVLNAGTIDIGGSGATATTTFAGDLVGVGTADAGAHYDVADLSMRQRFATHTHYAGAALESWRGTTSSRGGLISGFDVDMGAGTNDRLVVQGDFAGTWGVDLNPTSLLPGVRADLVSVEGADTAELEVLPSLVFSYAEHAAGSDGWRGFSVEAANFAATGLTLSRNAAGVARGLQNAWDALEGGAATATRYGAGAIAIDEVFAAFHGATPETFEGMLWPLASHVTLAPAAAAPQNAIAAASSLLSCSAFTTGVLLEEGECVWGRALGSFADQGATGSGVGYDVSTAGFQTGGQKRIADGWYLGGSLTYENAWFRDAPGLQSLDTQTVTAGAAVKREVGPWLFALAAGGGYTWGEASRSVQLGTLSAVARSDPASAFAFGRARVSYEVPLDERFYLRPLLDVDVVAVHQEGYRESGAGALSLIVDDATEAVFGVTPGIEVGARLDVAEDLPLRAFAGVGVSVLSDDRWKTTSRFAGLSSMDGFATVMPIADTVARLSAGLDLQQAEGFELKLQYDGALADGYQSHGGSLRLGYRF